MPLSPKTNRKGSARQQIDIRGVQDDVLLLSGDRYRMVLEVSSVNFELKSEEEQDALIDTYESFLNSLGMPLQILVRTRELDLDKYLTELNVKHENEPEAIYRQQLAAYTTFIRSLVQANKILTKHFYVVVPHDTGRNHDFEAIKEQLNLAVDIVRKGLGRLGMQSRVLPGLEILDLFYSFYSPEQAKLQPLSAQALQAFQAAFATTEAS